MSPQVAAQIAPSQKVKALPEAQAAKQASSPLHILLALEGDALTCKDRLSLKHLAVNKSRNLIQCGHIFLITRRTNALRIEAISSQSTVDKNTPLLTWLTREIKPYIQAGAVDELLEFDLNKTTQTHNSARSKQDGFEYPFNQGLWAPFSPQGERGGLLLTKASAWTEGERSIAKRLGQIYGVQWAALGAKKRARLSPKKRYILSMSAAIFALVLCIPVPVTTLAPAEIVAADPIIVTAPIDGVIQTILIEPNSFVSQGMPLVQFEDTQYRNEHSIAAKEYSVATARLRQTGLSAFVDEATKREIAVARAEQSLAATRRAYASDMLQRTVLNAQDSGLVLFSDTKDWQGRPVATGERIMEIADPRKTQLRIEAPISDSAALIENAKVKVFLDSDPLNPIEARLTQSSYYAEPQAGGEMAYQAYAEFETSAAEHDNAQRIGSRGVAKIYGKPAPLGFWLLRRPISSVRQFFGF